ncbi:MAG: aminotransferase class IV [Microbacterium arborescens]
MAAAGVKSLSYAVQRAALREARRRGADDAIFITDDGFVLEGAISTVVLRRGGVWVTPDPADGALDGTTQRAAFAGLRARGDEVVVRSVEVDELLDADAVWLCSSGRLVAPVRSIDGHDIPVSAASTRVLWRALGLSAVPAGAPDDEEPPC